MKNHPNNIKIFVLCGYTGKSSEVCVDATFQREYPTQKSPQ